MSTVCIALEQLCESLPWHFLVDADRQVVAAGPALHSLIDGIVGRTLEETFLRHDAPTTSRGTCCLFESRAKPHLILRGELVPTSDGRFLFLGSPQARSSRELEEINGELELRLEHEQSERGRVEAELRLAHRLEAVGQLAAGVAHEINTPIQYVGNSVQFLFNAYTELAQIDPAFLQALAALRSAGDEATATSLAALRDNLDADFLFAQVPRAFERALDGLERVAGIVRAMKAFAHPGDAALSFADINEALANTLAVARNEYKYVADVETTFADLPRIPCYAAELNQVFLNLVVNAAHAVEESVEGTSRRGHIRIRTTVEDGCAVVAVEDDGVGIPDAIKARIFDPFFTTKPVGKGTGQGLTITRSIVAKHQGRVEVRSKVGEGTSIRVHLPIEERQAAFPQ